MNTEEKAKRYEEALERAKSFELPEYKNIMVSVFPELAESEDERIRKALLEMVHDTTGDSLWVDYNVHKEDAIAWLEKQKVADEEIIFRPIVGTDIRIAAKQALEKIDIGKKVVLSFNGAYIPVNGKTVGEIDSEYDAWLEKQGDQKSVDKEYTFKSIPRLLDMIEPTDRAKSYCKKLIDSLQTEGYSVDAKIVGECLKQMNGEKVAMAVMDNEKQDEKKSQRMVSAEAKEALYDKPTDEEMKELLRTEYEKGRADTIAEMEKDWSEEDDVMINKLLAVVKLYYDRSGDDLDKQSCISFLKSLKDKVQPQPKQEWSEEDENRINRIIIYLESANVVDTDILDDDVVGLNHLNRG